MSPYPGCLRSSLMCPLQRKNRSVGESPATCWAGVLSFQKLTAAATAGPASHPGGHDILLHGGVTTMPRPSQPLSWTQRASALWSQGAALVGALRVSFCCLLHQRSKSNKLGSQDGRGLWEETLFCPAPKTVRGLRRARRDTPLFVIPTEVRFPVSV